MRRRAVVNAAADPDTLGGQMEDKLPIILCAPERCARRSDRPKHRRAALRASVLKLPRNSRRVFVRLGSVQPELAAVSLDTTPLPTRHRGVRIGGVSDREPLFRSGDPPPRRD